MKIIVEFDTLIEFQDFIEWQSTDRILRKTQVNNTSLSRYAQLALSKAGIEFLEDAFRMTDVELLKIEHFGKSVLRELRDLEESINNNKAAS